MAKDPTIPFYAQDFYMDTAQWEEDELGAYIRLLCYLWINGFCHNSAIGLANISPKAKFVIDKYKDKFTFHDDGKITNNRLEIERDKRLKNREIRSKAGKLGADKRWQTDSKRDSKPIANEDEKGNESNKEINVPFSEFKKIYNFSKNMIECEKLWIGEKKTKYGSTFNDLTRQKIMDYLPLFVERTFKNKYPSRPYPHSFLFQHQWLDEVPEVQTSSGLGSRRTSAPQEGEDKYADL